jgi:2,4-dienoyl-CoA reductase [(3E)-enoyl-CoA-producing], peroxisomal
MTFFARDILKGEVALVTGGHSGIGFEISDQICKYGGKVVMVGRRASVLDDAASKLCQKYGQNAALGQVGDVRSFESMQSAVSRAVESYGKLSIVVNSAAGNFLCAAEDLSAKAFKTVVEIDLIGTFNTCRAAFDALKACGHSSILNISATLHYAAVTYQSHAAAAKAGVDSLTRSLANEWGKYGIRVNGVAPGPIAETEGLSRLAPEGYNEMIAEMLPVRRIGQKSDIATACVFLASPASGFITGVVIVSDGGEWVSNRMSMPEPMYEALREARKRKAKL